MKISAPYVGKKYQNINNKLSSVIMEHPLYDMTSKPKRKAVIECLAQRKKNKLVIVAIWKRFLYSIFSLLLFPYMLLEYI
jgi:hypothetical protein